MYDDMVKQHGLLWLYGSIFFVLPPLLPELIKMWFKITASALCAISEL